MGWVRCGAWPLRRVVDEVQEEAGYEGDLITPVRATKPTLRRIGRRVYATREEALDTKDGSGK